MCVCVCACACVYASMYIVYNGDQHNIKIARNATYGRMMYVKDKSKVRGDF